MHFLSAFQLEKCNYMANHVVFLAVLTWQARENYLLPSVGTSYSNTTALQIRSYLNPRANISDLFQVHNPNEYIINKHLRPFEFGPERCCLAALCKVLLHFRNARISKHDVYHFRVVQKLCLSTFMNGAVAPIF